MYLSSGQGRTGDSALGNQDEIDLEFKGNEPTRVQSNVFFNGEENLQVGAFFSLSVTGWSLPVRLSVLAGWTDGWMHGFDCGKALTDGPISSYATDAGAGLRLVGGRAPLRHRVGRQQGYVRVGGRLGAVYTCTYKERCMASSTRASTLAPPLSPIHTTTNRRPPVNFNIDGNPVRSVPLYRPLQDMQLHLSVWTTTGAFGWCIFVSLCLCVFVFGPTRVQVQRFRERERGTYSSGRATTDPVLPSYPPGGWPGLIRWGGYTNWGSRGNAPVEAIVEFISYPDKAY